MIIKNLENKIKLAGILSIGCFATSIVISGMVLAFCFSLVKAERKKIYVLDNDVPVLVKQTGTEVNLEVECKSHINLFHTLFFTLPPDDEFIKYNMEKAMYLIDDSGLKQYNNLKEKGYFNTILASSATVTIMTDSIKVDGKKTLVQVVDLLEKQMDEKGLASLLAPGRPSDLARPRQQEIFACLNRCRELRF